MQIRHLLAAVGAVLGLALSSAVLAQAAAPPAPAVNAKTAAPKAADAKPADPFKGLAKSRDDMAGVTWYRHPSSPKYHNSNGVYLYFGKYDNGSITPLRLVAQYASDSWLFVENAWAKADGTRVDLPQESGRFMGWERDNGGGGIWEWSDKAVFSGEDKKAVLTLAQAKKVTVRYQGKKYYDDRTLSAAQLKALRDVVAAYEAATGAPWN
jgi:hypothetical protein